MIKLLTTRPSPICIRGPNVLNMRATRTSTPSCDETYCNTIGWVSDLYLFLVRVAKSLSNSLSFVIASSGANWIHISSVRFDLWMNLQSKPHEKEVTNNPRLITSGSPYTSDVEAMSNLAPVRLARPNILIVPMNVNISHRHQLCSLLFSPMVLVLMVFIGLYM